MKLLMINDFRQFSGAETHLATLSKALEHLGVEVATWCYQPDNETVNWWQALKRFKPDILHLHNFSRLYGEVWEVLHQGIPTVLSLHDYAMICPQRMRLYQWKRCATPCNYECGEKGWAQGWARLLKGKRLVTFNPGSAAIFRAHGLDVAVIPHGIDLTRWQRPPEGSPRRGLGFVSGNDSMWWKGYETAVEIAAALGQPLQAIRGGEYSQEKVAALYQACQVWLNPCIYDDTFGLTTLEALACGSYVVSYDTAGARTLLGNGSGGCLVPLGDKEAFRGAVKDAFDLKRSNAWDMGDYYNAGRMAQDWVNLYRSMAF